MKLVYPEYDLNLELEENKVNILVIENHEVLAEIVRELYCQCSGGEGKFALSEGNKILQISKSVNFMLDMFSLNCNDKKIITKLYQEIEELAMENMVQESMEINTVVVEYLEKMCDQVPYHMCYQAQILPAMFLKMVDLRFEAEGGTLLESIIEYLGITNKIFHYTTNIFLNLKMFLTTGELQRLYEYAFYNKISLILIEGYRGEKQSGEKATIIDIDKCTINI